MNRCIKHTTEKSETQLCDICNFEIQSKKNRYNTKKAKKKIIYCAASIWDASQNYFIYDNRKKILTSHTYYKRKKKKT